LGVKAAIPTGNVEIAAEPVESPAKIPAVAGMTEK
jgi:hypothetical protein